LASRQPTPRSTHPQRALTASNSPLRAKSARCAAPSSGVSRRIFCSPNWTGMPSSEITEPRSLVAMPAIAKPALAAHADRGSDATKRRLARARPDPNGRHVADVPELVGDVPSLFRRLRRSVDSKDAIFVGFDFPIGLPIAYPDRAGVDDFVDALPEFGRGSWKDYYAEATDRSEIGLRRPFYPYRPGGTSRDHLVTAPGVTAFDELRRRCERRHAKRLAACPLFWTLGDNEVRKGAILGWRDDLSPGLREFGSDLLFWPFGGPLSSLFRPGRIVVAETYPAEIYHHLGIDLSRRGGGGGVGKRAEGSRAANAVAMVAWAAGAGVVLDDKL